MADTRFSPRGTALEGDISIEIKARQDIYAVQTDFVSPKTSLTAGKVMALTAVRFSNKGFSSGQGNVNLMADQVVDIFGARFQVANVSMSARTIVLDDVSFAANSTVRLYSQLGQLAANPNTGAVPVVGKVNFGSNVTHSGFPAQFAIYDSSTNPTGPIHIGVRK